MDYNVFINFIKNSIKKPFYNIYERRLGSKVKSWNLPKHIGIIMDGNRRYARQRGFLKAFDGHALGAKKLMDVINWSYESGIPVITLWSFSIDNFQRDESEVKGLLKLFEEKSIELLEHEDIRNKKIKIRYIGKLELLPESLQNTIKKVENATSEYNKMTLNIAMAYGGREEILDCIKQYLKQQMKSGNNLNKAIEELNSDAVEPYLYTYGMPEPDLIIRTSGEIRLSGFLLWQSVHSEFYFCDTFWPAFRKIDFLRALRSFDQRQRRFGK